MKRLSTALALLVLAFALGACAQNGGEKEPGTPAGAGKNFSALFIGNSYSDDTISLAYNAALSAGFENIEIADLYVGGCSVDQHIGYAQSDAAVYEFRCFDGKGNLRTTEGSTMEYGVKYRNWDYIVLQQASRYSGVTESYANIGTLIDYVKNINTDVKFAFNMTWAYALNSENPGYSYYGGQQKIMYDAIVDAVQTAIVPDKRFTVIIPAGTAIQNVRSSFIGDTLTRDDSDHLTYDLGRYTAALAFVCSIGRLSPDDISFAPIGMGNRAEAAIKEAVSNALVTPFAITPSSYL